MSSEAVINTADTIKALKMRLAIELVALVLAFGTMSCCGQDFPFRNTTLPFEERVKVLQ